MKYVGYILLYDDDNDINKIEEQIEKFFDNYDKLICLDKNHIDIDYIELIEYSKKESLIYKIKLLEYYKIYDKLSVELIYTIYIKLLKKYFNLDINRNLLKILLFK